MIFSLYKDCIFLKSYGFLSFGNNMGKNISNSLSVLNNQPQMQLKLLQKE